ncbi:MAG: sigma-70 family RNA polymerase sigma factor [Myxococcota bacterium]
MRPDMELFEAWKAGGTSAGEELFERHFEAIRRFFLNKVDAEVEELMQQTFVRCVEGKERFEGRSSFRTYLFAVAHNVLREFLRKKRRDGRIDFGADSVADLGPGASTFMGEKREQRALMLALRKIPIDAQVALELYYWEQLTGPQLGEVLGVPENTARSRVRRAKEALLRVLEEVTDSAEVLQSTTGDLDGWASSVRALLPNRK